MSPGYTERVDPERVPTTPATPPRPLNTLQAEILRVSVGAALSRLEQQLQVIARRSTAISDRARAGEMRPEDLACVAEDLRTLVLGLINVNALAALLPDRDPEPPRRSLWARIGEAWRVLRG